LKPFGCEPWGALLLPAELTGLDGRGLVEERVLGLEHATDLLAHAALLVL
jgi:hypothetical protein